MSEAGAGSSQKGRSQGKDSKEKDHKWIREGSMEPLSISTSLEVYLLLQGDYWWIFTPKQHFVGGFKNAMKCEVCPEHVRVELQNYMVRKSEEKEALSNDVYMNHWCFIYGFSVFIWYFQLIFAI